LLLSISPKDLSIIANYTDELTLDKVIAPKVGQYDSYKDPNNNIIRKLKNKNYLLTNYFPSQNKTELVLFGEDLQVKKRMMVDFQVVDLSEDQQGTLFLLQNDYTTYPTKSHIRTVSKDLEALSISKIEMNGLISAAKFLPDSANFFVVLARAINNKNTSNAVLTFHEVPICSNFVDSITTTLPNCTTSINGTVSVYSKEPNLHYYWSTKDTTSSIKNLVAGVYNVTITNQKGCALTKQVNLAPLKMPSYTVNVTQNNPTACFKDGTITVTNSDPTFTYLWNTGATTASIKNLDEGTYIVTMTNALCGATIKTVTLQKLYAPGVCINRKNPDGCLKNGYISFIAKDNTMTYLWENGIMSDSIGKLDAGTYKVTMTNLCGVTPTSVTLYDNFYEYFNVKITQPLICQKNGIIEIVPNGTQQFNYLWSNGATTQSIQNLSSGKYVVTISIPNGCSFIQSFNLVSRAIQYSINSKIVEPLQCFSNGSIAITIPDTTLSFVWSNGATTPNIQNLKAGTYYVTISNQQGCSFWDSIHLYNDYFYNQVSFKVSSPTAKGCFKNGSIIYTNFNDPTISYQWNTGATGSSLKNLSPGKYTVTMSNAFGCSFSNNFVLVDSMPPIVVKQTNPITCYNNGSIEIVTSDLTFSYLWNTGATTKNIQNLFPGTYQVTMTNSCGSITKTIVLTATPPSVTLVQTKPTDCYPNGSIKLVTADSTFSYLWNTGAKTKNIQNLSFGTYQVTMTNSCGSIVKTITLQTDLPYVYTIEKVPTECNKDGFIEVVAKNGNFSYLWNTGAKTSSIQNLTVGTYTVSITNGCGTIVRTVLLNGSFPILSSIIPYQTQPNSCNTNGSIEITPNFSMFSYLWSTGETTAEIKNLKAGTYSVTISSACASTVKTIVLVPLPTPTIDIQTIIPKDCAEKGSIKIVCQDTTYSYLWSNGATTSNLQNISSGTYTLTMTNVCGKIIKTVDLIATPTISVSKKDYNCNTLGSISLTNSDTSATYLWENGATTQNRDKLNVGFYSVTISNTCYKIVKSFTINNGTANPIFLTGIFITNPKCAGSSLGSIELTASAPSFTYTWSNGKTGPILTNCNAGIYTVTIQNSEGCIKTQDFTLTEPLPINVVNVMIKPTLVGATGEIEIGGIQGGTPPYQYEWSNGVPSISLTELSAGTYTLTITDKQNCQFVGTYVVGQSVSSDDLLNKNTLLAKVYPNPVRDEVIHLTLQTNTSFGEGIWEVYNTLGQQVTRFPLYFEEKEYRFGLNTFAKGLYLYILKLDGKVVQSGKILYQ
jgi:SprB repeat